MGSCLCKEKTRQNHESNSSRTSRGCRRSEERNRSPHSFEQEADFDGEGSSQLGRRMSMTNYVGNDVKDLIRQTLKVIRSLVNK
ncbi:hypothetical protein COOONC_05804 [Cooperia oncophora]